MRDDAIVNAVRGVSAAPPVAHTIERAGFTAYTLTMGAKRDTSGSLTLQAKPTSPLVVEHG